MVNKASDKFILARFLKLSLHSRWLLIANVLLIIGLVICLFSWGYYSNLLPSQQAAERWAGADSEMRIAQGSCFLTVDSAVDEEAVHKFRQDFEAKMLEISLEAEEEQKLYKDAWSAQGELRVNGEHGSATARAMGVGGDYFFFHPLRLRSGNYISEDDFMADRVMLDEELAWKLFGAIDVAGMTVEIGDNSQPFVVAGVVSRPDDKLSRKVDSNEPTVYLHFAPFHELTEKSISCYELVGPEPLTSFVGNALLDYFPLGDGKMVENNYRFDFELMMMTLFDFGDRTLQTRGVAFPDHENAARLAENRLVLLILIMGLLLLIPAVSLIVLIRRGWRKLKRWIKSKRVDYENIDYENSDRDNNDQENKE